MSSSPGEQSAPQADRDEVNRLFQLELHEDRQYQSRLISFAMIQSILLGVVCMLLRSEAVDPVVWHVAILALCVSIVWLFAQARQWSFLAHLNRRLQQSAPDYQAMTKSFSQVWIWRFDTPRLLVLLIPVLFIGCWIGILAWLLLRPTDESQTGFRFSVDRVLLSVLIAVVIWLAVRLRKVEKSLGHPAGTIIRPRPVTTLISRPVPAPSPEIPAANNDASPPH